MSKDKKEQKEIIFPDGMAAFEPRAEAPEWVKANIVVHVDDFAETMEDYAHEGKLDIEIRQSQGGKYYAMINTHRADKAAEEKAAKKAERKGKKADKDQDF